MKMFIHTHTDFIETGPRLVAYGMAGLFFEAPSQEVALKHRAKLFDGKSSKDHEVFRDQNGKRE